ncbi:hypothetical protein Q5Y75_27455 [Ruegeria sp. 2205SS24-7]|uniref:helix-turn-helix domain-containing protein n=1 Tax=Ruegeria discodermiae TaxID=3064389 RepID=UPI00274062FC|nr:hypothetical protein [Ruegeria sp. 2205SS24-7]MDP5220927.1 hypothetical protein [Ruegeria sp. 2205SS24-7]
MLNTKIGTAKSIIGEPVWSLVSFAQLRRAFSRLQSSRFMADLLTDIGAQMTHLVHMSGSMRKPDPYHYKDCGLDNIWLVGGVETHETPYGPATSIADLDDLHHAIALDIIDGGDMTGPEFRFIRTELELSQRALADLLNATEQQVHRWETGKTDEIPGPVRTLLGGYYIEATNPESRMKEHLDRLGDLDTRVTALEYRLFEMTDDHWAPSAA